MGMCYVPILSRFPGALLTLEYLPVPEAPYGYLRRSLDKQGKPRFCTGDHNLLVGALQFQVINPIQDPRRPPLSGLSLVL